ncbi:MAG: acyl-CoA dehydratase activase, partial [Caldisericia bacterium]|nr:acyl-CoA dehydratase activase [Caldisericia bacterium]
MITAGIDIGSVTTKVVIIEKLNSKNYKILSQAISPTGCEPKKSAEETLKNALSKIGLSIKDLRYVISTGYGRRTIEFGNETITEITCCAKGTFWLCNNFGIKAKTIIDLGGQDTKIISLDDEGNVVDFVMNDKCAAGTGRFLEVMSNVIGINLDDFGTYYTNAKEPVKINST